MREYRADLHLHTCLSACAEVEMIPPLIVDEALHKGLDIIAITDHNTSGNVGAVIEAASGTPLLVLPGMELQCREEVEVLCLFETLDQAVQWQAEVAEAVLSLPHDAERFGPQFVVDAEGDFVAEDMHFYQAPVQIGLADAVERVHALGGLVIPAHIERPSQGALGVLGIWPPELQHVDAAEVSPNLRPSEARRRYPFLPDIALVTGSDAHWLDQMGRVITIFVLDGPPSLERMGQAFRGERGQHVYVP